MKQFCILLLLTSLVTRATAQIEKPCSSCLPEGITFSSQFQIIAFQNNYPGCTEITGRVTIMSADITNLNGLNVLTAIGGYLTIRYNTVLTNLSGLEGLITVGGTLSIESNYALSSIAGLENLTSVGGSGLWIVGNPQLTSLTGLESLTTVHGDDGGYLSIKNNAILSDVSGLEGLTTLGRDLEIINNPLLTSLSGLDNIDASSITNMSIYWNSLLTTCDVKSICNYIANPVGFISINSNAPGCNNETEVQTACEANLINEIYPEIDLRLHTIPSSGDVLISYTLYQSAKVNFEIYTSVGQKVTVLINEHLQQGEYQHIWNTQGLPSGIYCCRMIVGNHATSGKILISR